MAADSRTKDVLCKYYLHSVCRNGDTCPFSHSKSAPTNEVCTYYVKGHCMYGDSCRYQHTKPDWALAKRGAANPNTKPYQPPRVPKPEVDPLETVAPISHLRLGGALAPPPPLLEPTRSNRQQQHTAAIVECEGGHIGDNTSNASSFDVALIDDTSCHEDARDPVIATSNTLPAAAVEVDLPADPFGDGESTEYDTRIADLTLRDTSPVDIPLVLPDSLTPEPASDAWVGSGSGNGGGGGGFFEQHQFSPLPTGGAFLSGEYFQSRHYSHLSEDGTNGSNGGGGGLGGGYNSNTASVAPVLSGNGSFEALGSNGGYITGEEHFYAPGNPAAPPPPPLSGASDDGFGGSYGRQFHNNNGSNSNNSNLAASGPHSLHTSLNVSLNGSSYGGFSDRDAGAGFFAYSQSPPGGSSPGYISGNTSYYGGSYQGTAGGHIAAGVSAWQIPPPSRLGPNGGAGSGNGGGVYGGSTHEGSSEPNSYNAAAGNGVYVDGGYNGSHDSNTVGAVAEDNTTTTSDVVASLCQEYTTTGVCSRVPTCTLAHGDWCDYCERYALHPTDETQYNEHIDACKARHDRLAARFRSADIECCICLEKVLNKHNPAERKFGLLSCEHAFCLNCIRGWRQNFAGGADVDSALRTCPVCRVSTHFITPSTVWPATVKEKEAIVDGYKAKLGSIDCKYFNFGEGTCPFGTSCMYKHIFSDGTPEGAPSLRKVAADEGEVRVVQPVRLSDFIVIKQGRIGRRRR